MFVSVGIVLQLKHHRRYAIVADAAMNVKCLLTLFAKMLSIFYYVHLKHIKKMQ